eukprot:CAMPEP_0182827896 /NCGR_PEP_ID=MMETSP0006_2-20121128/17177_2 /TAXON_ID=97485 /ORGANISM="Prymnesium parvum, Strain Texoma1" /LENGTH=147 /DNA_ID=CAMNT_0024955209 /DNA_START=72 /DNA_END=515 /DNA_ORIENTATION=-
MQRRRSRRRTYHAHKSAYTSCTPSAGLDSEQPVPRPAPFTRRSTQLVRCFLARVIIAKLQECHSAATSCAHASTPGDEGQRTSAKPSRRASSAEVPPMQTATALVPTRSAHTRTAEGEANVTTSVALARSSSDGPHAAGTVVYVSMR